jgi:hypothetical protein
MQLSAGRCHKSAESVDESSGFDKDPPDGVQLVCTCAPLTGRFHDPQGTDYRIMKQA